MVYTDLGRSGLALAWAGSMAKPTHIAIGSGSGAVSVGRTGLIAMTNMATFTTTDMATQKQFTMTSDFGANTLSGLNMREFGVITSGITLASGLTLWNIEGFTAITFDGTTESQIEVVFETF